MIENQRNQLFSPNPLIRLEAAATGSASITKECIPPKGEWIRNAFGVANAWLVVVGPSPGKGPGGRVTEPVLPVLGQVLPLFQQFADSTKFWRELFRLLRGGFHYANLAREDEDAALKLMMLVNLDTIPEGDSTKIAQDKLTSGLPRLKRVLDLTKPRLILALEQRVYDEICDWWKGFGEVGPERRHDRVSKFVPKSRWLSCEGESTLLTKTLQHPAKANFCIGYETEVSDCLGERIAEAACRPSRKQTGSSG